MSLGNYRWNFSGTTDEITCNGFHTWGCLVFVLDEANQSGRTCSPKWDSRGWVVSNIQTNEISPIQYVIQLERGHKKGLWKPTSKHFGEMVRRSRQYILPIRLKTSACFDLLGLMLSSCQYFSLR